MSDYEDDSRPLLPAREGFYKTQNKTQTVYGLLFIPDRSFRDNCALSAIFSCAWRFALCQRIALSKGWYLYIYVIMETFKTVFLSRWVDNINERCPKSILGAPQKALTRSLEDWKVSRQILAAPRWNNHNFIKKKCMCM